MPLAPEIITKDPDDIRLITFDCSDELSNGATVATVVSLASSPAGITFSGTAIVASNTAVSSLASGGTANTDYVVTLRYTTSDGEQVDGSGVLQVRHSTSA